MDESSPLLGAQVTHQQQRLPDSLSPNLRPRHPPLIATPCGPMKRWSELSRPMKLYFCFSVVSLLVLVCVTSHSVNKQHRSTDINHEDNFTVSLIQLFGLLFCLYYIFRGVLQENQLELCAFVVNMLLVVLRSVVIFTEQNSRGKQDLVWLREDVYVFPFTFSPRGAAVTYIDVATDGFLAQGRFSSIICLAVLLVPYTVYLMRTHNSLAFRWEGALRSRQKKYCLLNLCFSSVTFDLQAQVGLCILMLTLDFQMPARVNAAVGVTWAAMALAVVTTIVGAVAVFKKSKVLIWIFWGLNLPHFAFLIYVMFVVINKWLGAETLILEAVALVTVIISLLIKAVLIYGHCHLMCILGRVQPEELQAADGAFGSYTSGTV